MIKSIELKINKEARTSVNEEIYKDLIAAIKSYADENPEANDFYNITLAVIGDRKKAQ